MKELQRYARIKTKHPREFLLLQGRGCRWGQCTFCDYGQDVSNAPYAVNAPVLAQVTGEFGVLDIINSGSAPELDSATQGATAEVVRTKGIHNLWFEAHYSYRHNLEDFARQFYPAKVRFRCGVETFDPQLRNAWCKGIPTSVGPERIAENFQGVCLLACVSGQTREGILRDIDIAREYFAYASINVFCPNSTGVTRDAALYDWFLSEVYPDLQREQKFEILLENTDLGVG